MATCSIRCLSGIGIADIRIELLFPGRRAFAPNSQPLFVDLARAFDALRKGRSRSRLAV